MVLTAQQIYNTLSTNYNIRNVNGFIRFNLGPHQMVVTTRDVVGNIIENWVKDWMKANNIDFEPNPNTQTKPDIYLIPRNRTEGLLEIKAFDYSASANFDIADFKGLAIELLVRPYLLNMDALIFGYIMNPTTGEVVVKDMWLKKIWEISCPSERWPIKVQFKNQIISKIRPATWYSLSNKTKYKCFGSLTDFLAAFEETLFRYPDTHAMASTWKYSFQSAFYTQYKRLIDFPRWDDIKANYGF